MDFNGLKGVEMLEMLLEMLVPEELLVVGVSGSRAAWRGSATSKSRRFDHLAFL